MADAQARIRITAQDDSAAAFKKASANLEALQASAAGLAGSLGGALAVGGLTALITGAIDAADNLRDLSQATGITVESLGGLGFAAGQNGGSLEGVASAAGKLNKALAEAAAGSRAALEPFQALGISVQDAAGQTKAADVVFAEIADRFKTFNDGPEKSALALRLFGKAGAEQIALLNEGGEALRANIEYYKRFSGVTTEVAAASDQFNDTLGKVRLLSQSLGTSIAAALLPSLQAVADRLLTAKENGSLFAGVATAVKFAFDSIALAAGSVSFALNIAGIKLGEFIAKVALVLRQGSITEFTAISDAVREDIARATIEFRKFGSQILGSGISSANDESAAEKRRLGLSTAAVTKTNAPRLSGAGGGGDKTRKDLDLTNKALGSYLEQLDRQLQKNQDLSATEQALAFLRSKGAGATLEQAAAILAVARALDLEAEQLDRIRLKQQLSIEAGNEVDRVNGERAQRIQQLLASTPSAQFAQQQKDLDLLKESLDQFERSSGEYGISVTQYIEAVQKLAGISTELEKSKGLAEELGLSFTSAFEDAIVGGKSFSEVLKGLEQDILRIITRKLVTEPIGNAITGAIGGSGGIGGIFGNLFSGLFGARANGGPVQAGGSYLVGERGPEIFKAPSSGTIVPTSQLAGAGGRSMVIHINPPAGMSRQSSTQFAADVARQLNLASNRNN
jgi:hypothetical protein